MSGKRAATTEPISESKSESTESQPRIVALIPARGGSKSVPKKNIRPLGGKPLLAWSVEVAKAVPEITDIIVSTDDEAIARAARACGAEVMARPALLASDTALVIDTVRDVLWRLAEEGQPADIVVLLEPTCPFRSAGDIWACLELLSARSCDSVATFGEAKLHPHRAWRLSGGEPKPFVAGAVPWTPRQGLEEAYQLNGAVYACRVATFPKNGVSLLYGRMGAVVTPSERSIDIDSEFDLGLANYLLGAKLV